MDALAVLIPAFIAGVGITLGMKFSNKKVPKWLTTVAITFLCILVFVFLAVVVIVDGIE